MENKISVLIVDDEQIVLDSIKRHLRKEDKYQIDTALEAETALDLMEQRKYSIVLTDLMMPEIDGLELLKIVKDKYPKTLVVMITGYATINTALQAMQLGAFDYLAKPFTRAEIKQVISRAADLVAAAGAVSEKNGGAKSRDPALRKPEALQGIGQHSWLMKQEDDAVLIGVERPFLINVGKIQSVYLPAKGDTLRQGSVYFQVFSDDLRSQSLLSPISGTVIEANEQVNLNPNEALRDPYGGGWLLRIKPSNFAEEVKLIGL